MLEVGESGSAETRAQGMRKRATSDATPITNICIRHFTHSAVQG
jgi:hypothetical protein